MHSMSLFGSSVAWWRVMLGLAIVPAVAQVHLRGEYWMCQCAGCLLALVRAGSLAKAWATVSPCM